MRGVVYLVVLPQLELLPHDSRDNDEREHCCQDESELPVSDEGDDVARNKGDDILGGQAHLVSDCASDMGGVHCQLAAEGAAGVFVLVEEAHLLLTTSA